MRKLNIIILSAFCISSIKAQNSFDDYVSAIVDNNVILKGKQAEINTSTAELNTINNLSDPEVEFSHRWGQNGIGNKWDLGIKQNFEWPGVYSSRNKEIDLQRAALDTQVIEYKRELTYEVKSTIYTIISANRMINLYTDVQATLDSLLVIYEKGRQMGEISILDVNKLKVETISNQRRLSNAKIERDEAVERLRMLNGGIQPNEDFLAEYPASALEDINVYMKAASTTPQIRYNELMYAASLQSGKTAKMNSMPGFSLGYIHEYEMGERFNGFSVGVTLPFFSNKKKSIVAQQAAEQYSLAKKVVDEETASKIREDYESAVKLRNEMYEYKSILDSTDNVQLLDKALKGGQISLVQYLQELRFFIEAKADYNDVVSQYNQRLLSLNQYN